MPFNLYASVFIPKENITPEFLECMGFTEKEMQHIYNERERADDYAKYNVKTIIVGNGKNGI